MDFDDFKKAYSVHRMDEQDKVAAFDCGDEDLNGFILNDAPLYRKEKLAVTYTVLEKATDNRVVAFFSLSNDRISISDFDNKTKYNRFSRRFNNHKRLAEFSGLYEQMSDEQRRFLHEIRPMNIEARYPDYKRAVAKSLNAEITSHFVEQTKQMQQWILQKCFLAMKPSGSSENTNA